MNCINKFDGVKFQSWHFTNTQEVTDKIFINKKNEIIVHSNFVLYQLIKDKFQKITIRNLPKMLTKISI